MPLIQPAVLESKQALRRQFETAQPFRYVVMDEFLDPDFCQALTSEFPVFDAGHARNELGQVGRKAVHPNLKELGPAYREFDRVLQTAEFLSLIEEITGIPKLLYDPQYVGGGTHENLHGQDLDTHVDFNYHPNSRLHRRLNLIVFLNPVWQPEWGGQLELQKDPALPPSANVMQSVLPLQNRCVIFETTEASWHGFRRIALPECQQHLSRKSLAIYLYTRERPASETAPSHGTIYIHQPLPEFVQAGYTLRPEDAQTIKDLVARRDTYIRFLYERELEFSRIAQSPSFRLARALTWPLRKLRDLT